MSNDLTPFEGVEPEVREFWSQNREFRSLELPIPPTLWDFILEVVQPPADQDTFDVSPTQFAEAHRRWVRSGEAQKPYSGWGR